MNTSIIVAFMNLVRALGILWTMTTNLEALVVSDENSGRAL